MNRYRLFLLSFATVCLVFMSGFGNAAEQFRSNLAEQQTRQIQIKQIPVQSKSHKAKNKRLLAAVNSRNDEELRKTLDLSLPLKDTESILEKAEQSSIVQQGAANVFVTDKKKQRSVNLDGQMLMSQEPEMDKKKSLDGAAIVINLKR
ncbi:MAG: hypothetical protein ACXV8P_00060 [Methylobacter sp.]